jgi:hypothetical protein
MNLGQSLRTGETGETCFWDQGPAQKSWPIIGDRRDGRNMLLGARSGSEILANHWGQERREKHAFGCKVRLRNPGQSLGTGETGETCFWVQGQAQKSWPIIEILANHWRQERRERHVFGCKVRLRNPANHWGQERRERHVFGCKVRLMNLGQSLGT